MVKHLYIIGNGFDLHHSIDSSFGDFHDWMNNNHPDVINKVDDVYGNCDSHWWSDFENQLASLDAIRYGDTVAFLNQPDLSDDHCDGMWGDAEIAVQYELENLYRALRFCFHEWIHQLNKPQKSKKLKLSTKNAVFLNFNYTNTLEDLYDISSEQILHIHGCVDEDEEFILGHGKTNKELRLLNNIDRLAHQTQLSDFYDNDNNDEGHMLYEQLAEEAAIAGVASQKKPVEALIKRYHNFFYDLSNVQHIHVYGLSLSEVDTSYLLHILSIAKQACWEFSYHNTKDLDIINKFCINNKIMDFNVIDLNDLL